jgi:glycosyltransferase involved in cell wall biosynthesis
MVMSNLASQFARDQSEVQIITARWHRTWPQQVVHREVLVQRLPNPPLRGWGTFRYMKSLGRWLRKNHTELDAVYVSMLKHSAYITIQQLKKTNVPVILRAEGAGKTGDCTWQQEANFGSRIRTMCQQADAIVAPSEKIRQELLDADYDPNKIHYIPNGVAIPEPRSPERCEASRQALASVNPSLQVKGHSPVAVFTGRLHAGKGLLCAINAWAIVVKQFPNAKLWIIGEGPQEDELRNQIHHLNLDGRVVMPGVFDNVEDVLHAADLFVLPSHEEGMSLSLLEAMATGLPVVASDIPGNQKLVTHEQSGVLFPVDDHQTLSALLLKIISDHKFATSLENNARKLVEQKFSLAQSAQQHEELFRGLIAQKQQN